MASDGGVDGLVWGSRAGGVVIGDGPERRGHVEGLGVGGTERIRALLHVGGLGAEKGHELRRVLMRPLRGSWVGTLKHRCGVGASKVSVLQCWELWDCPSKLETLEKKG